MTDGKAGIFSQIYGAQTVQDLELLGRETSLGYDSSYFDLSAIWEPGSEEDMWQIRSEQVFSNLLTYRKPFAAFAHACSSLVWFITKSRQMRIPLLS